MFRKLNSLVFWFSRSRLRRGPDIDPRLKDYSSTQTIKKQLEQHRQNFQRSTTQTFTDVLAEPKPKLEKRFKVDKQALNRDIKRVIKARIKPQLLQPAGQEGDDLKFLQQGRSHLYDQRAQIQFQQKFDKQLFMKKQTTRLLKKQANNYQNFLPQNTQNRYNKYLQAKNKLKNKRIDSMMNYKRNNQELQLLLDSGLMDNPENIKNVIGKLAQNEGVQQIQQRMEEEIRQIQQSRVKSLSIPADSNEHKSITLKEELDSNVVGPQALRDYSKVQQFIDRYRTSTEEDKLKTKEEVDLLLQVREYQHNLFLSRYEQINFRFKGRVRFENFKEFQLLSYIKHEPIQPLQLLAMFEQNKEKLSKFNVPVVTPAVMSRIYTKTSTYRFAENDENNRINLLAHPAFIALEKTLFRELDKISDELYCDAVWTYATNHEQEEGLLNVAMSNAVQKAIFNEMLERIGRLREADLGLLVRSLKKMNLVKNEEYNERWGEVLEVLQQRLPLMKQPYEYESVMEFVHLLPSSKGTVGAIASNVNFFDKYTWEDKGTVLAFARICSILLNNNKLIDPLDHNKVFLRLSEIITNKTEQLKTIIPTLTINEISNLLIVFSELNKFPMNKEIPSILVNVAKKEIVDSIHMQKHKIYQYTVPTLIYTLSTYDYYKKNVKTYSKYIESGDHLTPYQPQHVGKLISLKHLLPGRTFVFNSKLFFVYHELAKFMQSEQQALSLRSIAESIYGLSLVQYKNEGVYDSMAYKMLERLQKEQMELKRPITLKQTNQLIKIVNAYSLQKRNTDTVEQIYDKILKEGKVHLKQVPTTILIAFFSSYVNIFSLPTQLPKAGVQGYDLLHAKWQRNKTSIYLFTAIYRDLFSKFLPSFQAQEVITLYIICTHFLNNTARMLEDKDAKIQQDFKEIHNKLRKNVIQLIKFIDDIPSQKIKTDYKFAISLCLKLNKQDIKDELIESSHYHNFQKIEKEFYDKYIESILAHEQHVGTAVTHKQAYQNMVNKLKKESPEEAINENIWRIEVPSKKQAYFIATYEHLMSKTSENQTSLGLFGLWKLYSQLYRRNKWNFHLVCSMLE